MKTKREEISPDHFFKADLRVGTILRAEAFPEARTPAFKLFIDFGELGEMKSSAQITELYTAEELLGRQVVAVINFPARQIGPFMSECLVLGVPHQKGVSLLSADHHLPNGSPVS